MSLVFVTHCSSTYFSEFTICQGKKKVNLTLMRAHIPQGHSNRLAGEEKGFERPSMHSAFVSASVPAQIGCKTEMKPRHKPPLTSLPVHISAGRPYSSRYGLRVISVAKQGMANGIVQQEKPRVVLASLFQRSQSNHQ